MKTLKVNLVERALELCIVFLASGVSLPSRAAFVQQAWVTNYNAPTVGATDRADALVRDSAGNVIVTGTSVDGSQAGFVTIKYSAVDGAVLWLARQPGRRSYDTPLGMAVDASGHVLVAGARKCHRHRRQR